MFLASWMAVALQPCAVAGEVEHDCPHCPQESMHEGHHQDSLSSSDCAIGGQLASEARGFQPKLDDLPAQTPVCVGHSLDEIDLASGSIQRLAHKRFIINSGGPPLNVLHCVYLK